MTRASAWLTPAATAALVPALPSSPMTRASSPCRARSGLRPLPHRRLMTGSSNAQPLCRRLQALQSALADVPRQALRLMRWRARRERQQELRPVFTSPLRPGLPPGYRRKPTHDVDDILITCHGLAFDAMKPDTS